MSDKDYIAYIRTSPASAPLPEQKQALEAQAGQKRIRIVAWIEDPGHAKAGHFERNKSFQYMCSRLYEDLKLAGVMFWHAGHIAHNIDDFLITMRFVESLNKKWYIDSCGIWSSDLDSRTELFEILVNIRNSIFFFNKKEKIITSKATATNPGKQRISSALEKKILRMRNQSKKMQEIAEELHVSTSTVHRVIRDSKIMSIKP